MTASTVPLRAALYLRVLAVRQAEHDVSIPDQKRKGFPQLPGFYPSINKAVQLRAMRFKYILVRMDQSAYVSQDAFGKEFTPEKLAEHLLSQLMDIVERTSRD